MNIQPDLTMFLTTARGTNAIKNTVLSFRITKYVFFFPQNCMASFSSLMGYQYHTQRCGREQCDREKLHFSCLHCSKAYRSKAGRDYHMRTEHCTVGSNLVSVVQTVNTVGAVHSEKEKSRHNCMLWTIPPAAFLGLNLFNFIDLHQPHTNMRPN